MGVSEIENSLNLLPLIAFNLPNAPQSLQDRDFPSIVVEHIIIAESQWAGRDVTVIARSKNYWFIIWISCFRFQLFSVSHCLRRVRSLYVFVFLLQRQGHLCACKVFRSDGGPREEAAKQREFEVMKKLSHDNIVKFYAIEQEVHINIWVHNTFNQDDWIWMKN